MNEKSNGEELKPQILQTHHNIKFFSLRKQFL